ncbi:MAG TPA: hypothetical protein VMT82_04055 [candidate division Zixibacteria bacterium]|nr:hypothetical protein [candidate division Zixibacteria bacterium]
MAEAITGNSQTAPTVGEALCDLMRHPGHYFVINWNWKSALLSACLRATIFLVATIKRGWLDISTAVAVEALFSACVSGIYGSFTQAMRFARPEWLSKIMFAFVLPAGLLALDYTVHYYTGMRRMLLSVIMAGTFSALSSLFNLYIMRHGALLVGREGDSLTQDMARMPRLIGGFLAAGPLWVWRQISQLLTRRGMEIN